MCALMDYKFPMTAIILAGGKSSRMGQDKALLKFGTKTILEHLVYLTSSLFSETLIIISKGKELNQLDLKEAKIYEDLIQESGPLAGLYTGLVYSKNRLSFVLTCDMPFVDEFVARKLAEQWETGFDVICLEEGEEAFHPFPGIYARSSRLLIKSLLESGKNAMKYFLQIAMVKMVELEKEKTKILTNMNYIEDYAHALKEKEAE